MGPERFAASSSVQRAGVRLLSNTGRLSNASERACRDHASAHLAEADAVILALRPAGQHDFIIVLEEAALAAVGELERPRAIGRQFEQRAEAVRCCAADR